MKKFFTFAVMFAAVAMVACGGQQKPAEAEAAVEAIEAVVEEAVEATEEATEEAVEAVEAAAEAVVEAVESAE